MIAKFFSAWSRKFFFPATKAEQIRTKHPPLLLPAVRERGSACSQPLPHPHTQAFTYERQCEEAVYSRYLQRVLGTKEVESTYLPRAQSSTTEANFPSDSA